MTVWRFTGVAATAAVTLLGATAAQAALVVAGSLQDEQGDPGDWDPPNSSLVMNDDGGGFYSVTANNLIDGTFYEFKVLDDEGTGPANWGDPEVVNVNTMAYGDADGSVQISVNTNATNGNGGAVTWVNSSSIPLQVVGDFQDEAGGASDWNPSDPTFAMSNLGDGLYSFVATISTPGSYQFKATDGTGWNYQVGTDGFGNNAGNFGFSTTTADEQVTMIVDVANGFVGLVPEPTTATIGLIGLASFAMTRRGRGH